MSDVFISHAQSTIELTRQIAEALRALGHDVWWDDELLLHQKFSRVINENVRKAKAVVVLWSSDAIESEWVPAEADVARQAGTLVQLSVDGAVPPIPFNHTQYADMTGWRGDLAAPAWRKLIASVDDLVGRERPARASVEVPHARAPLTGSLRKRNLAVLLVGGIAIASAAIWYGVSRSPASNPAPIGRGHADRVDGCCGHRV